jgi:S-DNA-T family DNA segregation ATPase FtsK/SpoIIIE
VVPIPVALNLEEFAITDEKRSNTSPYSKTSKYEVDKEALKPTISHSSEINLDPVSKVKPVEEILTDKMQLTIHL